MAADPKKDDEARQGRHRREVVDPQLIRALAHPIRALALSMLNERVASPNEIAKELGESVGHVSYHVNVLIACDCVELVSTAQRRGAVEHYYRATSRILLSDEDWARLPASIRPKFSLSLLQHLLDDAVAALDAGTFDARDDRHLSRTPMIVDERGWGELNGVLAATLERIFEIQAASAERLGKGEQAGIPVSVAAWSFEMPKVGGHLGPPSTA